MVAVMMKLLFYMRLPQPTYGAATAVPSDEYLR